MKARSPLCPCGSGARYGACCRPFHLGEEPQDAVRLMRSRFAAYALGEVDYLWRTLHPEHPDRQGSHAGFLAGIRLSRRTLRFSRLRVLDHEERRVLFHAEVYDSGREISFLELSTFAPDAAGWRYLSGNLRNLPAAQLDRSLSIASCGL